MSTKIYTAYRLKDSNDFWPFLRDVRRTAIENIRKVLLELFETLLPEVDSASEAYQKALETFKTEDRARAYLVERLITDQYRLQASSSQRDYYDFDVSIAVREHEGRLYLVPYCDMQMRGVLDFLKDDPRLEDFAYWNNSDQPKEVSRAEWDERQKIWDLIDATPPADTLYKASWLDYVAIDICTPQNFWQIQPFTERLLRGLKKSAQ